MERLGKTNEGSNEKLPELRGSNSRGSRIQKDFIGLPRTTSQGFSLLSREGNLNIDEGQIVLAEKNQNAPKEISKGISYLDVVSKVRDLERKYVDLASSLDRRVQTFIEENPQKILRHLKTIEDKENTLRKETQKNQLSLQDNLNLLKVSVRDNSNETTQILNSIIRRLDESDFKIASVTKGLENIHQNRTTDRLLAITEKPLEADQKIGSLEAEIKLLKEGLGQERQRRDTFFQDIMQQYQEINNYVHQNENNLLNKMRKHKEETLEENKRTKEQQRKLEEIKLEKLLNDSEYLKNLIRQVEGKVEEEINKRLKHDFDHKNWIEQKLTLFKQELKSDEKELLENEKKFLQNIQESMNSLSQIVTNTREQLEANLASTQTLFNENVKSLSKTMDLMKNNVYGKLNMFDTAVKELDQKASELQKNLHEHTIATNQTMEKEFSRIEKVTLKFEEIINENFKNQDEKLKIFEENNKLWKKSFEDKNLRVLTEISNALKILKGELNKEKSDSNERFENIRNQIDSNKASNEKLFEQINERIKSIETQFDYKLDEAFVKSSEGVKRSLDLVRQEIEKSEIFTLEKAKEQIQDDLLALTENLKEYTNSEVGKAREELSNANQNSVDKIKIELLRNVQSIQLDLADLEKQKNKEIRELRSDIKYLQEGINENKDENTEKIRQLSEEYDEKIKLSYQNFRNQATEKIRELKEEMYGNFSSHKDLLKKEVEFVISQNKKSANDLYDKIKNETKIEISQSFHQTEVLLEEEKKTRAFKDTEISNSIQSVKTMIIENINTKIESTQALVRALVNEETAERARNMENLTITIKKRIDALEKYFKDLISTSVEQAKLELKELIRNLDLKIEEHKVWTIRQLNIVIKEIEEYMLTQSVKQYTNDLYHQVEEKERSEQWLQVQDAFQVVSTKFEEIDNQRKEDLETIYAKENELDEEIEKQGKQIKGLDKNIEEIQENFYVLEEKFSNNLENLGIKLQVKDFLDSVYQKVEDNFDKTENEEFKQKVDKKFKRVEEQMILINETFEENKNIHDMFELRTQNNFKIAEKALIAHKDYLNQLDSRLTMEEMISQVTNKNSEQRFALELATVSTQVDLINEEIETKFNNKLEKYQKHFEEDIVPHQVLKLEDKLKHIEQEFKTAESQIKDHYQQKITEHELKLGNHEELLHKCEKSISQNSEIIQKTKEDIIKEINKSDNLDKEQTKIMQTEFTKKLDEVNKKIEDLQKGTISDNLRNTMENIVMKDVEKTLKPMLDQEMSLYSSKLKELETQLKTLEAKGGKGDSNSKNEEDLKKEISNLKDLIDRIQKELLEKEKANSNIDRKIENLNSNVAGLEKAVKGEMEKNFAGQNENHRNVSSQLTKLFDQLQTLQQKLDKTK